MNSSEHMLIPSETFLAYTFIVVLILVVTAVYEPLYTPICAVMIAIPVAMWLQAGEYAIISRKIIASQEVKYGGDLDPVVVKLSIKNPTKKLLLGLYYKYEYSGGLRLEKGDTVGKLTVAPGETVEMELVFSPRIGTHVIGPLKILVTDLLGFFIGPEVVILPATTVSVPPSSSDLLIKKTYLGLRSIGMSRTGLPGGGTVFYDVREYFPGDELRRVVWRIYASRRKLAVWETEKEKVGSVVFVIDGLRDMWIGPFSHSVFEESARTVTALTRYLATRGFSVMTLVFSEEGVFYTAGFRKGVEAYSDALKIISRVTPPSGAGGPSAGILPQVGRIILEQTRGKPCDLVVFTKATRERVEWLIGLYNETKNLGGRMLIIVPLLQSEFGDVYDPIAKRAYTALWLRELARSIEGVEALVKAGMKVVVSESHRLSLKVAEFFEYF